MVRKQTLAMCRGTSTTHHACLCVGKNVQLGQCLLLRLLLLLLPHRINVKRPPSNSGGGGFLARTAGGADSAAGGLGVRVSSDGGSGSGTAPVSEGSTATSWGPFEPVRRSV